MPMSIRTRAPRGAAVAAVAAAAALLVAAAPRPGAAANPPLRVAYERFTLPNGLEVFVHEDHSVPIVSVNTWYRVGSGDEDPGRTGFAHLFEHIMFMGSQHVPTGDFDRLLESAGADNNGSTNNDRTNYFEDGPVNALPLMVWLDSDRMGFLLPEITPEKVDLQRGVVQNERRQSYENQPYGLAQENLLTRLYPEGHPYRWPVIGSMADLSAATIEDVRSFFQRFYTPNNATMAIAGAVKTADVRALVERYFGDVPRGPQITRRAAPAFALEADVHGTLEDRVQVPRVYNAWRSPAAFHADDAPLDVLGYVLASGKSSRLYRRLVYEMQVASDVVAFQSGRRLDGMFQLWATARPGHALDELQGVIDEEIRRLAEDGPAPREIERVRNAIEAQFLDGMERVGGFGGKADQLNYYAYFTGEPDSFERDLARYRAVTAADVRRVARDHLTSRHRVVLSVVPEGKIELAVAEGRQP